MRGNTDPEAIRRLLLGLADFFELLVPKLREFATSLTATTSKRRAQ